MAAWSEFFIATAGAAAALSGTLLVAMSINIARIVSQPTLPGRAANALLIVASALIASAVALAPLTLPIVGGLAIGLGLLLLISAVHVLRLLTQHRSAALSSVKAILGAAGPTLVPLPYLAGGTLLIASNASGYDLLALAVLISFAVSLQNSWVLLVEILR